MGIFIKKVNYFGVLNFGWEEGWGGIGFVFNYLWYVVRKFIRI